MSSTTGEIARARQQICSNCLQLEGKLMQLSASPNESSLMVTFRQQLQEMLQVGQKCLDSIEPASPIITALPSCDKNERIQELELELSRVKEDLKTEKRNKSEKNTDNQQAHIASLEEKLKQANDANLQLIADKTQLEQIAREYRERLIRMESSVKEKEEKADPEQIVMLRAQLVFYKEDFEAERRDRERTQAKLADTEQQLSIARRQLAQYERHQMQSVSQRRSTALALHRDEYTANHRQETGAPTPLVSRGVYQTDSPITTGGYDEIDCAMGADSRGTDCATGSSMHRGDCDSVDASEGRREDGGRDEVLACPLCRMEFKLENHSALLEHIETCSV